MNDTYFIQQMGDYWRGFTVICMKTLPRNLPHEVVSEVLSLCYTGHLSPELCFTTLTQPGLVSVLLILRARSMQQAVLQKRLTDYTQLVLNVLQTADFQAALISYQDKNVDLPNRFFGGDLAKDACAGFFTPAWRGVGKPPFFVPGEYGEQVRSIPLDRVINLMAQHPQSMFSVQMNLDGIAEKDAQLIEQCIRHFTPDGDKTKTQDGDAMNAMERYNRLKKLRGEPMLYHVQLLGVGPVQYMRALSALFGSEGFRSEDLRMELSRCRRYLLLGSEMLRDIVASVARAMKLDPQFLRYGELLPWKTAASLLPMQVPPEQIRGLSVNNTWHSNDPLPAMLTNPENSIEIGRHMESGQNIYMPMRDLNKHGFIVGKSGSGKTTVGLGFLHQIAKSGIPFLSVEPTKAEYRTLIRSDLTEGHKLKIYTPGNDKGSPLSLNPFLPPKGVTLDQYLPTLKSIFDMAVSSQPFVSSILPKAMEYTYTQHNWRLNSTRDSAGVKLFGMNEFIRCFRDYVRYEVKDPESQHNVENSGIMQFQTLTASNTVLFDTNAAPDFDAMFTEPTIIELEGLGNDTLKAIVCALLMINLRLYARKHHWADGKLRGVVFIDEAHALLSVGDQARDADKADPRGANLKILQDMVHEIRAAGFGIFFGDQHAMKLTKDIAGDTNMKLMLRADDPEDFQLMCDVGHLDPQMKATMATLVVGEGYFQCGDMFHPVHVQTPNWEKRMQMTKDVQDEEIHAYMQPKIPVPFNQCRSCGQCPEHCDLNTRYESKYFCDKLITSQDVRVYLNDVAKLPELPRFLAANMDALCETYAKQAAIPLPLKPRTSACIRVQTVRALLNDGNCDLNGEDLEVVLKPTPKAAEAKQEAPKPEPPTEPTPAQTTGSGFFDLEDRAMTYQDLIERYGAPETMLVKKTEQKQPT